MPLPLDAPFQVFAIADLHLPGGHDKPMHIFGMHWHRHFERISEDWRRKVGEEDVVLLPGDISWAMYLQDAASDLQAIGELPGKKIMIRGNHDYWWSSIGKIRAQLPEGFYALQNDALQMDNIVFCGTRGWCSPGTSEVLTAEDEKIYLRELQRLELSLQAADRLAPGALKVAMLHFPPFNERHAPSGFMQLLLQYGVHTLVYGHLHDQSLKNAFSGIYEGMYVHNTSCDGLGFQLLNLRKAEEAQWRKGEETRKTGQ